ncbi:MAG: hypothetical protein H7Y37_20190 [Anaerolineae bacterium]|nr:hypothetical protein [Gloeobacterales cyanobacterium ES-bin-313]
MKIKPLKTVVVALVMVGTLGAGSAWSDDDLISYINQLLDFILQTQTTTYSQIPGEYSTQLANIYGSDQVPEDQAIGALSLPDTFSVGLSISNQSQNNPYNLGPFAPRSLVGQLISHSSNRSLTRAFQTYRVSETGQSNTLEQNNNIQSQLQESADLAASYASAANEATSTQDVMKLMNQQIALVNTSSLTTTLQTLQMQNGLDNNLGNLQMLVSDVSDSLDTHLREQYYNHSQQILDTTTNAFAAAEIMAWHSTQE